MNNLVVQQTAQGLVRALEQLLGADHVRMRGVVIGYDHRASPEFECSSLSFALHTAGVFVSQGIKTFLFDGLVATPLVPFAITSLRCAAGCMITASHNPKEDAGFKLYWENGCQIVSPIDDTVQRSILANLEPWPEANALIARGEAAVRAQCINPMVPVVNHYVARVVAKLCRRASANAQSPPFCYTAMHGVGLPFATRVFAGFGLPPPVIVDAQARPDYAFPTVKFPNPEEHGALALAQDVAAKAGCRLILANDPDADRLAVAEASSGTGWAVFTGDEIAMLLADWEMAQRDAHSSSNRDDDGDKTTKKPKAMVISAVSSRFVKVMGERRGVRVDETLTGFKWIGNRVAELQAQGHDVLLSYEEAIGFCVGDVVRDKDGISAAAVFAEMAGALYARGSTCQARLRALREEYGFYLSRNGYVKTTNAQRAFDDLRNGGRYALLLGGVGGLGAVARRVVHVRDLQSPGGLDTRQPDLKPVLPKASQMITLELDDGTTITVRASGTEPKLKYYVEAHGVDEAEVNERLDGIVSSVVLGRQGVLRSVL